MQSCKGTLAWGAARGYFAVAVTYELMLYKLGRVGCVTGAALRTRMVAWIGRDCGFRKDCVELWNG